QGDRVRRLRARRRRQGPESALEGERVPPLPEAGRPRSRIGALAPMPDVPPEADRPAPTGAMPAEFGTATATFVVVASMVGVGVLTTSGYTVAAVGSNQLMLLLWVVGGVAALCGALTLAELSASVPDAGGEYAILHRAYGPLAAFLSGWVTFLLGF